MQNNFLAHVCRLDASPAITANAAVPNAQILENLKEAYGADTSGMTFWEIARSHRSDGVFDEGFTEYLNDQIKAAPDKDDRCVSGQNCLSRPSRSYWPEQTCGCR